MEPYLDEADWAELAAQTELEGELLIGFLTAPMDRVKELRGPDAPTVGRVLDIGCGPGGQKVRAGETVPRRADDRGVGARVSTHLAELPGASSG